MQKEVLALADQREIVLAMEDILHVNNLEKKTPVRVVGSLAYWIESGIYEGGFPAEVGSPNASVRCDKTGKTYGVPFDQLRRAE